LEENTATTTTIIIIIIIIIIIMLGKYLFPIYSFNLTSQPPNAVSNDSVKKDHIFMSDAEIHKRWAT
jgi:hypothetical protein